MSSNLVGKRLLAQLTNGIDLRGLVLAALCRNSQSGGEIFLAWPGQRFVSLCHVTAGRGEQVCGGWNTASMRTQ
jgi:hypothetical protein